MEFLADAVGALHKHHGIDPEPPLPGQVVHEHVGALGHSVLWIVTFSFLTAFVLFVAKTASLKPGERSNAYTSIFIVAIAGLSYYAMATRLGSTELHAHEAHGHTKYYRQLFYARYIDWIFTTPLLLLELVLIAGLDLGTTIWVVFADVIMILSGLFGSFAVGPSKWGWFIIGDVALVAVLVGLWGGRSVAARKSGEVGNLYSGLTGYLLVLWVLYPIVWAFGEGSGKISVNAEVVAFGILDVLAKVVFAGIIFFKHDVVASANTSVASRLDAPLIGGSAADEAL